MAMSPQNVLRTNILKIVWLSKFVTIVDQITIWLVNVPRKKKEIQVFLLKLAFATCFFCGQQGHIVRECPKNPKGLYS